MGIPHPGGIDPDHQTVKVGIRHLQRQSGAIDQPKLDSGFTPQLFIEILDQLAAQPCIHSGVEGGMLMVIVETDRLPQSRDRQQ